MDTSYSNHQLIEQLEVLTCHKKHQDEFINLIQLLKLKKEADKEHLQLLVDNIDEGFAHCQIICSDAGHPVDYKILSVNSAYEKQTGINAKDIIGKTVLEFYPDIEKSWIDIYGKVALSGEPHSFVNFNHNTKRHYQTKAYALSNGHFALLFQDVTESIELTAANLEIEESHKLNTDVLENMLEAFMHCEIICNEHDIPVDYRFLYVNKSFESHTSLKTKDILGKTVLELYPDVEKSWIETLGRVAQTLKSTTFVKYNHNTNKYYQTCAFSSVKGEFRMFLHDVTDQEIKRVEILEAANKKAEESENLKSAFLANMSHEVRTPLNAILGFSSLLEDEELTKANRKICLDNIKISGNRLIRIISDILDISKIDEHQQKLVYSKCNLNQLLANLYKQHTILNTNSNIELKFEKKLKNEACSIITDEIRISQILSNLIENALKYTIEGEVVFGYTLQQNYLQFYVKDTGIGIGKEDQKIIFSRFGQVNNRASLVASGTGLGISIAKGLVSLLKGEMWVESEPDIGSCFYFTIPYNLAKKPDPPKAHKYTILIAEDDDVNFLLLDLWLNNHFNIVHATNGFEAVQLFQKSSAIDFIIMDIRMPYMNGIEATKEIRKLDMHIPIIAHTAFALNEESVLIKKAGCDLVLIKPITREQLLNVLAQFKITA